MAFLRLILTLNKIEWIYRQIVLIYNVAITHPSLNNKLLKRSSPLYLTGLYNLVENYDLTKLISCILNKILNEILLFNCELYHNNYSLVVCRWNEWDTESWYSSIYSIILLVVEQIQIQRKNGSPRIRSV